MPWKISQIVQVEKSYVFKSNLIVLWGLLMILWMPDIIFVYTAVFGILPFTVG